LLHCLQAGKEPRETLFADGFAVALFLREHFPEAYNLLTWNPVPFRRTTEGHEWNAAKPLIQVDWHNQWEAIHYDSRFLAPLRFPADVMQPLYAAYRLFALLLRDPRFLHRVDLAAGCLVACDNRRVLQGWEPISNADSTGRYQECYVEMDAVLARLARLEPSR
jgi:gamma-butyrobetaine dioxygenase